MTARDRRESRLWTPLRLAAMAALIVTYARLEVLL